MNECRQKELKLVMSQLFSESLKQSRPLAQLETIRQKIEARGYQVFDKKDILLELGQLQQYQKDLNAAMLRVHDLLKQG